MAIEFSAAARTDLLDIMDPIAENNPVAAMMVNSDIHRQIAMLADQPGIEPLGRIKGTRELVLAGLPYVVAYRVRRGVGVTILRVLHTSRDSPG
jgi:toxin ParE1/3/4